MVNGPMYQVPSMAKLYSSLRKVSHLQLSLVIQVTGGGRKLPFRPLNCGERNPSQLFWERSWLKIFPNGNCLKQMITEYGAPPPPLPPSSFLFLFPSLIDFPKSTSTIKKIFKLKNNAGLPWQLTGVKNPPADAGDMGSIPDPGRSHIRRKN